MDNQQSYQFYTELLMKNNAHSSQHHTDDSDDDAELSTQSDDESRDKVPLSEKAQMLKYIQHNDIQQIQQQLLSDYVKTLPLNTHYDAFYILTGFNNYIKALDKYKEQYKYNVLSLRSTIILGKMLSKIDCITKRFMSISNVKAMFYTRTK